MKDYSKVKFLKPSADVPAAKGVFLKGQVLKFDHAARQFGVVGDKELLVKIGYIWIPCYENGKELDNE